MSDVILEKWVAALRSGNYEQGVQKLGARLGDKDTFCCLGVLCDVVGLPRDQWFNNGAEMLPLKVRDKVGINCVGSFGTESGECLAALNDVGKTFSEIADFIEDPSNLAKMRARYHDNPL